MFRISLYINTVIIFIITLYLKNKSSKKYANYIYLKGIISLYLIFTIANLVLTLLVDIGYNYLILYPFYLIMFILDSNILNKFGIKKLQKANLISFVKNNIKNHIIIILLPIIIITIPFLLEFTILNNCNYLLKYNYQNGIVESNDSYYAIINNRLIPISLRLNIIYRKNKKIDFLRYDGIYNENGKIKLYVFDEKRNKISIENEMIESILIDARTRIKNAKSANIDYLKKGNYSIVTLLSEEGQGSVLGEYFYHNDKFVCEINTSGSIEYIKYYK